MWPCWKCSNTLNRWFKNKSKNELENNKNKTNWHNNKSKKFYGKFKSRFVGMTFADAYLVSYLDKEKI